jgi:hypothetical protein
LINDADCATALNDVVDHLLSSDFMIRLSNDSTEIKFEVSDLDILQNLIAEIKRLQASAGKRTQWQ